MSMDEMRLKELALKYFLGTLSSSEKTLLETLLQDPNHQEFFVREARTFSVLHDWAAEQLQEQDRITRRQKVTRRGSARPVSQQLRPWLVAAAALLIAIAGATLLLRSGPGQTPIVADRSKGPAELARKEAEKRLTEIEQERRKIQEAKGPSDQRPDPEKEEERRRALAELEARRSRIEEELRKAIASAPKENPPAPPPAPQPTEQTPELKSPEDRSPGVSPTQVAAAVAEQVEGEVHLVTNSGKSPLKPGQQLLAGQGAETIGAKSSVVLVFGDKTRIEVSGDSAVVNVFEAGPSGTGAKGKRLQVTRGTMFARVAKQPLGQPLVISSSQAEAVVLGTSLRLIVDPGEKGSTRLEVTEGKVELKRLLDGKMVMVESGHYAVAAAGAELAAKSLPTTLVFGGALGKCEDTFIYGYGGYDSGNYGALETLRSSDGKEGFVVLLRFPNLVGPKPGLIPARSTIASAGLKLKVQNYTPQLIVPVRVHRALKPWKEGRGDGTGSLKGEATWKAAQQGLLAWEAPGATGATDRSPEVFNASVLVDAAGFLSIDVTPAVQSWANGEPNQGLILISHLPFELVLSSSEDKTPANRPQLAVTFSK